MKRVFRATGFAASLLAVLLASGGHWAVLQSIAWTRMLIANARTDTLVEAVAKTFDGKHPCKMCHEIQAGREQERHGSSLVSSSHAPRLWLATASVAALAPSLRDHPLSTPASTPPADFVGAPPEPPPRTA